MMNTQRRTALFACVFAIQAGLAFAADPEPLPKVRAERPRIFLREKAWDGPSLEKIKTWLDRPEYKAHMDKLEKSELSMNRLMLYVLRGDQAAGKAALDRYMTQVGGGVSPSYWGIKDQRMAALYDWLHDNPAFTADMKKEKLAQLERRCAANMDYLKNVKENPFYSRFPGALAALTTCALSMYGDSPKAEEYLRFAFDCLRGNMSSIRQAEGGGSGGGSYGYHHEFTDLANCVAAWRSATDWDAAAWIKKERGNWLGRQMLFQIWMTYPSGRFAKDGDLWARDQADDTQYRMQIDTIAGMYRDGFGRSHADVIYKRWGAGDYHSEYVWQFFVFNDPEIPPRPLSELGKTEVFGRDIFGTVCWRGGWGEDDTIILFRGGEAGDTHATWDPGKFTIYRQRPLAIKNGAYIGWMTPQHQYYKSPSSANCVVFGVKGESGMQPVKEFGRDLTYGIHNFTYSGNNPLWPKGLFGWEEWLKLREKTLGSVRGVTGKLIAHEANEQFARAAADLPLHVKEADGSDRAVWDWKRELVFLGYKYLIVLDRVRGGKDSAGRQVVHAWTLHTVNEPKIDGRLVTAENGPATLYCQTLLPTDAKVGKVGGPGHEYDVYGVNALPKGETGVDSAKFGPQSQIGAWRIDVTPPQQADGETIYLHVLYAAAAGERPPAASVDVAGGKITVNVEKLSYTFK